MICHCHVAPLISSILDSNHRDKFRSQAVGNTPHLHRSIKAAAVRNPPPTGTFRRAEIFLHSQAFHRSSMTRQHRHTRVKKPIPPPHTYVIIGRAAEYHAVPRRSKAENCQIMTLEHPTISQPLFSLPEVDHPIGGSTVHHRTGGVDCHRRHRTVLLQQRLFECVLCCIVP